MRAAVWARCAARFRPGFRILEMNCGTGEDARWLASQGMQVLATDIFGQATLTPAFTIRIDAGPPRVTIGPKGGSVLVRVSDTNSGVAAKSTSISFGDGKRASGGKRFRHHYAHGGVYQVVVKVRDKLGNSGTVRKLVSVR